MYDVICICHMTIGHEMSLWVFWTVDSIDMLGCPGVGHFELWIAYSPPGTGGVAAHQEKYSEATFESADGVVSPE